MISIDQGAPNYYHICANIIPDIVRADNCIAFDNLVVPDDTRILREYLDLLGIKSNIFPLRNKAVVCEASIIPETCSCLHIDYDQQSSLTFLKKRILHAHNFYDGSLPKKIFIERRQSNNGSQLRHVYPVETLHEDLKRNKWQIIYMEDLSVQEQIKLFYNAHKIMAVHGAALTNIIYSNEAAHIHEIVHARGSPECFIQLSKQLGLSNYKQVSCDGLLSDLEEERLKLRTGNMSNNILPLRYNEEIKQIILS